MGATSRESRCTRCKTSFTYGIDKQSVLWKLTGVRGWPHVTNMTGHEAPEAAEGEDLFEKREVATTTRDDYLELNSVKNKHVILTSTVQMYLFLHYTTTQKATKFYNSPFSKKDPVCAPHTTLSQIALNAASNDIFHRLWWAPRAAWPSSGGSGRDWRGSRLNQESSGW